MYRRVEVEWRIAVLSAGLLLGVALAPVFQVFPVVGIVAVTVVLFTLFSSRLYVTILLFIFSSIAGAGYGSSVYGGEHISYSNVIGAPLEMSGKIREDPSLSGGYLSLQLNEIKIKNTAYRGSVFARLKTKAKLLRGERVTVEGLAEDGFGNFSLSLKDAKVIAVERSEYGDIGRSFRDWFAGNVRKLIGEPQASLGIGYLTGQKSALPEDLADALKIAGLTHIVVASGYNLTVLVRLARRLFLPISKFSAAMAAAGMVVLFMAVTGLSPSMTRAGLVSGLSILFWYYGRKVHPIVLLLFVAAVTVLYQPGYVWGDLGWQLSFAAFFGVMIIGPLLQQYFFGARPPNIIWQTLIETTAAHIATVPVIALSFGVVSNVAIVANILVVPLVPIAMLLTFACGIWGIFSIPFAQAVVVPTEFLLKYMIGVAEYVAGIPWAQSELEFPVLIWVAYVLAVGLGCLWMWRATKYNLRTSDSLQPLAESRVSVAG